MVEIKYCEDPFAPNFIELKQRLKNENVEWVKKKRAVIALICIKLSKTNNFFQNTDI